MRGDVPNDRIERTVHRLQNHARDLDPELVFDLVEQFGEVEVGTDLANIVSRSHTPPAIAEWFNVDLPNPDWDVLGDSAVGVMSLIKGSVVQLRSVNQFSVKAYVRCIEGQVATQRDRASHGLLSNMPTSLIQ
jgi:hypothetical protein